MQCTRQSLSKYLEYYSEKICLLHMCINATDPVDTLGLYLGGCAGL